MGVSFGQLRSDPLNERKVLFDLLHVNSRAADERAAAIGA
jgi:hypothetical protein